MPQVSAAAHAILTATARTSISPAELLNITAEALAERHCSCREQICRACREAGYLDKIAASVDRAEAVVAIIEACGNTGADLVDLLPGVLEGILDHDPTGCTCTSDVMCPTCSAARDLDDLTRGLRAA